MKTTFKTLCALAVITITSSSCNQPKKELAKNDMNTTEVVTATKTITEKPEYFLLRPEVEKAYGYSHAVKIGNAIKISGAVSMDAEGNATAVGDLGQQMKNCYAELEKVLAHYRCTFYYVVAEKCFTTEMSFFS